MRLRLTVTATLVSLALTGAACSDDEVSAFCEDQEQLAAAVDELKGIDISADGTDALKTDVEAVQTALSDLRSSGGDAIGDEVDALEQSVDSLRSGVTAASGTVDKVAALASGLADVQASLQALKTAATDAVESCS